ncbi:NACHT domain-containing protein [Pseudomonas sp. CF10PS3]
MIVTAAMTTAAIRSLTPLIGAAYKGASKSLKANFSNWSNVSNLEDVAKNLLQVGIVKTIWSSGKSKFIKDFYYPSRINNVNQDVGIDHIDQLPNGNIVIQGIVGQGKSMFMRHLACSAISETGRSYIPVFIELQKINQKKGLKQLIFENLDLLGITVTEESFKYLASKGYLALLLDGFDEIVDTCINDAIESLDELQRRYPKLKIIVSSRPGSGIQQMVGFDVLDLTPLNEDDYEPFLKCLQLDSVKRESLIAATVSAPESVKEIISTPLMLTLVVWVYESEQEIPSTLRDFFEKLFHVVFTRHDSLKVGFTRQHYSGLSETKLLRLFEAFCFMIVQESFGRSLTRSEFNTAFTNALEYSDDTNCDVDSFRKDIVKVACLMLDDGLDLTTFLHKSILDYYAAAFILHSEEDLSALFYADAFEAYSQWQHVLFFLADADKYRYSKYYILEHFQASADEFNKIKIAKNDQSLLRLFNQKLGNFHYLINNEGEMMGWSGRPASASQLDVLIERRLVFAGQSIFKENMPESQLSQTLNLATPRGKPDLKGRNYYNIDINQVISIFGTDEIWDELGILDLELHRKIEDARLAVALQTKKKKIFGKKIRTGN